MTQTVSLPGSVRELAQRARRYWPVGLAVAVITALVGMAVTWDPPRVFVSRATVYPPTTVTTTAAAQRYISDFETAVNSPVVLRDVSEAINVPRSSLGDEVIVRRVRQSGVMDVGLRTPDRLDDPGRVLQELIARAGHSLSAPDVAVAQAQRDRLQQVVDDAEDAATAAKGARDAFLDERNRVTPEAELAILAPELAELRLCASGAIVPPGADPASCADRLDDLERTSVELAQASDELAALDRDLATAESVVADAERDLSEAEAAVLRADAGPVAEVSQAGREVSQVSGLLRRGLAIVIGAVLLGLAVMVILAVVRLPERRPPKDEPPDDGAGSDADGRSAVPPSRATRVPT